MTILEIILAVSFGLFVVFATLVGIRAAVERGNFLTRAKVAGRIAKSAEATARMWRRHLDEQSKARRELDQGVGRAVCRIISAHSEEHCLRRGTDPDSYYPGQGKQHAFIAQGMLRALNILEEETGRYKEEEEEPSPAYITAQVPLCALCGKQATGFRVGQCYRHGSPGKEIPLRFQDGVESPWPTHGLRVISATASTSGALDTASQYKLIRGGFPVCTEHGQDLDSYAEVRFLPKSRATHLTSTLTRRNIVRQSREADHELSLYLQSKVRYPNLPPGDCVVCGGHSYTYRWGQCISKWSSETNISSVFTTIKWEEFDPNFEVGWVPVCANHAADLDGHGSIACASEGYHRG